MGTSPGIYLKYRTIKFTKLAYFDCIVIIITNFANLW